MTRPVFCGVAEASGDTSSEYGRGLPKLNLLMKLARGGKQPTEATA